VFGVPAPREQGAVLNESVPARALLAVLPDREAAEAAASRLAAAGVDPAAVRIDAPRDEVTSLEAEQREEVTQSFNSPTVGVAYPKETVKAGLVLLPPITAIGAIVGALVTLAIDLDGWPLWGKALVGAVVGGVMTSTIAAIVVPAMSVKNPHDPSVAEVGVTLRVEDTSPAAFDALVAAQPLRLDRLGPDDNPLDTVMTEEQTRDGGIVEEVRANFAREAHADPEDKTR
jgi:hypothetical protein